MEAHRQERILVPERDPQAGARRIMAERGLANTHKVQPCRGWTANGSGGPMGPRVMIVARDPLAGDVGIVVISDRWGEACP